MPEFSNQNVVTSKGRTRKVLYYIHERTSEKHAGWRNTTIWFIYELFKLANRNPAFKMHWMEGDGLYLWAHAREIAYLHFYQQHFLVHANPKCLIWEAGHKIFQTDHEGSWQGKPQPGTRCQSSWLFSLRYRLNPHLRQLVPEVYLITSLAA